MLDGNCPGVPEVGEDSVCGTLCCIACPSVTSSAYGVGVASGDNPAVGPLLDALRKAGLPKPGALTESGRENRAAKKNWAQRFSNALAMTIADQLRPKYPHARVTPRADGRGQEFSIGAMVDRKRTDVGIWDDAAGLIAGVSIKTYTFRDTLPATGTRPARVTRYVKNVKRNDMELRDEADTLHRRQPFAVLTALFFMNEDACWDGIAGQSSFAHAVFTLRKRAGRAEPDARFDLFEQVFVGLFDEAGHVRFFDVRQSPRKNQPPADSETISLADVLDRLDDAVVLRNTGVGRDERYAEDDPGWTPPAWSLPADLEAEKPLTFEGAIGSPGEEDDPSDT
jgi:hypothetical protein